MAAINRSMTMESHDWDLLRKQAEEIVESGQLGKSELYPKEIDIALDVFGKDESFNVHEDSIVRVYVHSLRGKLDEYYRNRGRDDEVRIEIPKGAYRVVATLQGQHGDAEGENQLASAPRRGAWMRPWLYGAVALALLISALGNIYLATRPNQADDQVADDLGQTFVWADLVKDHRPITIVLGGIYFYSEFDPELGRDRYIGDIPINSREALRMFLKRHPDRASRLGPVDSRLLTQGTAYGLAAVMPIIERDDRSVKVTILSNLNLDDVRKDDIVFIGPLHRLGPLAEYYKALSWYKYDRQANRLVDKKTGKALTADGSFSKGNLDYGMFAKFRGPEGNHILILGSVASDVGLQQIVRSMTSTREIHHLKGILESKGGVIPPSFEALFSATGYEHTDLTSNVIDVHGLKQPPTDDNSGGL